MTDTTKEEQARKSELMTLIGKLRYLAKVCSRARLTLNLLTELIKDGHILTVNRVSGFTIVNFPTGNLTINSKGGVLFTLYNP